MEALALGMELPVRLRLRGHLRSTRNANGVGLLPVPAPSETGAEQAKP